MGKEKFRVAHFEKKNPLLPRWSDCEVEPMLVMKKKMMMTTRTLRNINV